MSELFVSLSSLLLVVLCYYVRVIALNIHFVPEYSAVRHSAVLSSTILDSRVGCISLLRRLLR